MTGVRFGINGSGQQPARMPDAGFFRMVARTAEELGYDSLWASDHISFRNPILEGMVALSFFAGATTRITLGTGIFLLPLRHPSLVAKQVASLDVLAEGRLIFGVGVGGEGDRDFAAVQISPQDRGPRTDEAIDALRTLWSQREAAFHGRFFDFDEITIDPPPTRPPPVWIGGRAGKALERAGRRGDGWLAYLQSVKGFTEGLASVRLAADDAGRDRDDITPALMLPTLVRTDGRRARRDLAEHMTSRYGRGFPESAVERICLAGTPTECVDRLGEYLTAGARHIVFNPAGRPEAFADDAAMIAEEVVARIAGASAPAAHERDMA